MLDDTPLDDAPLITRIRPGRRDLPPVVLLHGSGQDETALLPFAQGACSDRTLIAVRGRISWESGYAFFRRRPDRSLDEADLAAAAAALSRLLADLRDGGHQPPILLGYSNGAIAALAAVLHDRRLSAGAILLRPLTPRPGRALPRLDGYPILLVSGSRDPRRDPSDAATLARQLTSAGAAPTLLELPIRHDLSDADRDAVEAWLMARSTDSGHPQESPLDPGDPSARSSRPPGGATGDPEAVAEHCDHSTTAPAARSLAVVRCHSCARPGEARQRPWRRGPPSPSSSSPAAVSGRGALPMATG